MTAGPRDLAARFAFLGGRTQRLRAQRAAAEQELLERLSHASGEEAAALIRGANISTVRKGELLAAVREGWVSR